MKGEKEALTCRAKQAQYKLSSFPLHRGNPLIEALPDYPAYKASAIAALLEKRPEPLHAKANRRQCAMWLSQLGHGGLFVPFTRHYDIYETIDMMIREGYRIRIHSLKNLQRSYFELLNKSQEPLIDAEKKLAEDYEDLGDTLTAALIGCSGIGKTRTVTRVLSLYDQVIVHDRIAGVTNFTQIVYLRVECPHDGSIKSLCLDIISEIGRLTGEDLASGLIKSRSSAAQLKSVTARLLGLYNVGILVIDEIQNLLSSRYDHEQLFNFIVAVSNTMSVPLFFVGTPKAGEIMHKDLRIARRFGTMGVRQWRPLEYGSKDWNIFLKCLWSCNVLPDHSPEPPAKIEKLLYTLSQGITDLLIKILILSQMRAMVTEQTSLSEEIINTVFDSYFNSVRPMIAAMQKNDTASLEKYHDISLPEVEFNNALKLMNDEIFTNTSDFESSSETQSAIRILGPLKDTSYSMGNNAAELIAALQNTYEDKDSPAALRIKELLTQLSQAAKEELQAPAARSKAGRGRKSASKKAPKTVKEDQGSNPAKI